MACGTGEAIEVIGHGLGIASRLVALDASYRQVTTRQNETALLVFREGECRRVEAFFGVALLALVKVRRAGELSLVCVLVTVGAKRELHFEERRLARRNVALRTVHAAMFAAKRKSGIRMVSGQKSRSFPALYRVTAFALSTVGPLCKLSIVWIELVTIGAKVVSDRSLEISSSVTCIARNLRVLAGEHELGF